MSHSNVLKFTVKIKFLRKLFNEVVSISWDNSKGLLWKNSPTTTTCTELFIVNSEAIANENVTFSMCRNQTSFTHIPMIKRSTVGASNRCLLSVWTAEKRYSFRFWFPPSWYRPDTDHRHYLDTSPVLRSERTATEAGEKFRLGSTRAEITTSRDVIGFPARCQPLFSASDAAQLNSVCRLPTRELSRMKLCGAMHSQINYWQKQSGEWKRDPKPS